MNDKQEAAQRRHDATYRAYRRNKVRYVVEAVDAGQRYSVRVGGATYTVWAESCDKALTKHLENAS